MAISRMAPNRQRIPVPTPAAGQNWTYTNDTGGTLWVHTAAFTLTTNATVAQRLPSIRALAGEETWFATVVNRGTAASQTRLHCAFNSADVSVADADVVTITWPATGLALPPGHRLASVVQGLQAGDVMTGILLSTVEYPETSPEHMWPAPPMVTTMDEG